jgi:hypothetical protein
VHPNIKIKLTSMFIVKKLHPGSWQRTHGVSGIAATVVMVVGLDKINYYME